MVDHTTKAGSELTMTKTTTNLGLKNLRTEFTSARILAEISRTP